MESATSAPVEELEFEDNPFYEVVDEKIVECMPMGAYELRIAMVLAALLENFVKQQRLGRAVQEMLFDLRATVQRMRRPDVAFVSYERWPRQKRIPRTQAWDVVPELAVEVISPADRSDAIVDKVAEYFRAGVRSVWVIFPSQEQVYVYTSPTQVRILSRAEELQGEPVLPNFRLPLTMLFEEGEEDE